MIDSSNIDLTKPLYQKTPEKYKINKDIESDFDRQYAINKVFEIKKYGKLKILGIYDKEPKKSKRYVCEFLDTGFQTVSKLGHIKDGCVKDYLLPDICEIASVGYVKTPENNPCYKFWDGIIRRCTGRVSEECSIIYKGVTISERWRRFDHFLDDLKDLIGFKECIENGVKWDVDKDLLIYGNKLYSKETCCIIPGTINAFFTNNQRRRNTSGYIGVSRVGKTNKWASWIRSEGKNKHLGNYATPSEAYEVYHKEKIKVLEVYLQKDFPWLPEKIKDICSIYLEKQYEEVISRNKDK
jgi:hypothetical protein